MPASPNFDVIVVGGGIAGSTIGGILARAGLGVLVVEREAEFRDRVRADGCWPWGAATARALGLHDVLAAAGVVAHAGIQRFEERRPVETQTWGAETLDGGGAIGFCHPGLQGAAFTWAAGQGATTIRPAKAIGFAHNGQPTVTVVQNGREVAYSARLVIGADGKLSAVRRWTGGESIADAEHHRIGGVLVSGAVIDRAYSNYVWSPGLIVNWFAAGPERTRLYLAMAAQRLRDMRVDRSIEALVAFAAGHMPEGALTGVQQAGPIAFFPNHDIWASRLAGNDVVLIGDAAGAPDPTRGHGTPMLFRDVRALSELLLWERDWGTAIAAYAERRERDFAVMLAYDRWHNLLFDEGAEGERLRAGNARAREHDPTIGGFGLLEARGPDGLVADEVARRHYFGEDLA
jgi:menaquinone-9 beta-reductase